MWPPRRSDAFIANSRFTRPAGPNSLIAVTSSVWFIASVSKPSPSAPVAVRQTPLTATESPGATSAPSKVLIRVLAPSAPESSDSTVPTSWIRPVNISPLLETGRDQGVVRVRVDRAQPPTPGKQDRGDEYS